MAQPKRITKKTTSVRNGKIVKKSTRASVANRSIRTRSKRRSIRNSSGDDFFENLINNSTMQSPTIEITQSNHSQPMLNSVESLNVSQQTLESQPTNLQPNNIPIQFEEIVLQKLNEILIRMDELEKHSAKIEARIHHITSELNVTNCTEVVQQLGNVDVSQLARFGMPVTSQITLDTLEANLSEEDFANDIVSKIFCMNERVIKKIIAKLVILLKQ